VIIKDNEDDSLKTDEDNEEKLIVKTGALQMKDPLSYRLSNHDKELIPYKESHLR
jgi:hypothetical protein